MAIISSSRGQPIASDHPTAKRKYPGTRREARQGETEDRRRDDQADFQDVGQQTDQEGVR